VLGEQAPAVPSPPAALVAVIAAVRAPARHQIRRVRIVARMGYEPPVVDVDPDGTAPEWMYVVVRRATGVW
jgi:hypothetical protein